MRRLIFVLTLLSSVAVQAGERPNILIAISDDQSFPHASAYGCKFISTPAFDRVANEGILFTHAYAASPGCSPSRAALLTGRHHWQIEHAGTHASSFPAKYRTFPEVLAEHGYFVGQTGKGWGPGNFKDDGRTHNPAGPTFQGAKISPPYKGISNKDYAANFQQFLKDKPDGQPFCFWYGAHEPHRGFEKGAGLKAGKRLEDVEVPSFLPDRPEIREDLLDYAVEIEWFDQHLGRMLDQLEAAGELENTLVIVTADNGMAFPRAKANCYDAGIHVPLAIRWGQGIQAGRTSADLVGFVDLTATIYDVTGVTPPNGEAAISGQSLRNIFESSSAGIVDPARTAVFSGRERHSSSRYLNLGYPQRAMRTRDYLYIRNFRPDRWPAGAPRKLDANGGLGPQDGGYHDIDACPSLTCLIENQDDPEVGDYFHWAVDMRPEIEIFDLHADPGCLHNLANADGFEQTQADLTRQFEAVLQTTGDPRILNGGDIFETYPRYSGLRQFPIPSHVEYYNTAMQHDGWIPLFQRRHLDGWTASKPDGAFTIVNGMIKAQPPSDQAHLFYSGDVEDADFQDFELLVYVMTTPGSNSGIYFHTQYQEQGFPEHGHEVQVNNTHKNKNKTGSLFSVKDVTETVASDHVFFTEHIIVKGKTVTIKVNGETVVEYTEPEGYQHPKFSGRRIDRGTFALQAHDPQSVVYFREIWVKPLSTDSK